MKSASGLLQPHHLCRFLWRSRSALACHLDRQQFSSLSGLRFFISKPKLFGLSSFWAQLYRPCQNGPSRHWFQSWASSINLSIIELIIMGFQAVIHSIDFWDCYHSSCSFHSTAPSIAGAPPSNSSAKPYAESWLLLLCYSPCLYSDYIWAIAAVTGWRHSLTPLRPPSRFAGGWSHRRSPSHSRLCWCVNGFYRAALWCGCFCESCPSIWSICALRFYLSISVLVIAIYIHSGQDRCCRLALPHWPSCWY